MAEETTGIRISRRNRDRLSEFGKAGESLDTALDRVLKVAEDQKNRKNEKQNPLKALMPGEFTSAVPIPA